MNRRSFLTLPGAAAASRLASGPRTLLVVSGWQDINIGDIAHTPGLLYLLQRRLPRAKIVLWKRSRGSEAEAMLQRNFPAVRIIHGDMDADGNVREEEVRQAFREADRMIHGSGPGVVGEAHLRAFVQSTGKPFGIFGVTIPQVTPSLKTLLPKADFLFTRETASLKVLAEAGIQGPDIRFVPDATFSLHLKDEAKAAAFLKANGLENKKFICAVPRLRKTPYYKVRPQSYTAEQIREIDDLNQSKKEQDHSKLREALIAWVRTTGHKVLVCPEMTYETEIMDELLIQPLPPDIRTRVVKHDYWMPDEASSVYERAFAVLSFECHSPIIALAAGTPAFYLRQPEDSIKGQMYYDLDLADWVFEIEQTGGSQIAGRLQGLIADYSSARKKVEAVRHRTAGIYQEATARAAGKP